MKSFETNYCDSLTCNGENVIHAVPPRGDILHLTQLWILTANSKRHFKVEKLHGVTWRHLTIVNSSREAQAWGEKRKQVWLPVPLILLIFSPLTVFWSYIQAQICSLCSIYGWLNNALKATRRRFHLSLDVACGKGWRVNEYKLGSFHHHVMAKSRIWKLHNHLCIFIHTALTEKSFQQTCRTKKKFICYFSQQ